MYIVHCVCTCIYIPLHIPAVTGSVPLWTVVEGLSAGEGAGMVAEQTAVGVAAAVGRPVDQTAAADQMPGTGVAGTVRDDLHICTDIYIHVQCTHCVS